MHRHHTAEHTLSETMKSARSRLLITLAGLALSVSVSVSALAQGVQGGTDINANSANNGPVRLRQPNQAADPLNGWQRSADEQAGNNGYASNTAAIAVQPQQPVKPYKPGEFEAYVQSLVVQQGSSAGDVQRFGADLMTGRSTALGAPDHNPLVPPDYAVQYGDELLISIWGSVDADLRLTVDRSGRITIPRVGPVMVSGVRYADLADTITKRVALVFKNFQLSVSLGQLRGQRVYVTGFVNHAGAQVVSSLSTLVQAVIRAGGPSAAGSFRNMQLRRGNTVVATFDLYDLLLKGDRSADRILQADDVIHIGPVGAQVGIVGSVNRPAVFELKLGETVEDLLRMAGGFAPVADTGRVTIERVDERASLRVTQIDLPAGQGATLHSGDVVRALNAVGIAQPAQRQNKRVRIEGEVLKPGEYIMPASSTLTEALERAGGLAPGAFLYGAEFYRESVRNTQLVNYERALRDLETEFARNSTNKRVASAEEATALAASTQASSMLIDRLRVAKPTGRVVLQLPTEGGALPPLALEHGDKLYVPARPTAVGVFGSVFNAGSYLYSTNRIIADYLRLAGGPTRGADEGSIFVVRANGSVVSAQSTSSGWFGRNSALNALTAEPGDTIFVPEELSKTTFVQGAKDWTQIFYQLGLGIAGLKSALK